VGNFITSSDQFINSQSFTYGSNGLPNTSTFSSSGLNATTPFAWRSDGQLDTLDSQSDNGAFSKVVIDYNAKVLQLSQTWTNSGNGFSYSEVIGRDYTRNTSYDAQNRPAAVSFDLDSDGNVDASFTLTWESMPCIPTILWAPNGFPNFVKEAARPFVPGTGFVSMDNCTP